MFCCSIFSLIAFLTFSSSSSLSTIASPISLVSKELSSSSFWMSSNSDTITPRVFESSNSTLPDPIFFAFLRSSAIFSKASTFFFSSFSTLFLFGCLIPSTELLAIELLGFFWLVSSLDISLGSPLSLFAGLKIPGSLRFCSEGCCTPFFGSVGSVIVFLSILYITRLLEHFSTYT